ncbi:von Willebrand factor D and EGF domain-containing protein-like [Mercenaria mercenaria]|uniref:von Willebrand factor D and EGF domain-containing protein-like n=1 Tax=Mercenaria mercenaria TaxID=6596 RepID=UPI00234EFCB8|nr:von Willebrand factor D and EGF domain-containing protein-like [Mercenaria mercenaria]
MPDLNSKPKYKQCGTVQPIYLKELHPDVNSLTETSQSLVACEFYPFDSCLNEINIAIRKCGEEIQYYLKGTSSNSAFCFDPPDLLNVTDLPTAPTVNLGTLAVKPDLRFKETEASGVISLLPFLVFICEETGGDNKDGLTLFYTTYWYIDDKLLFTLDNSSGLSILTEDSLISNDFSLGIMVRCGAKLARDSTGLKTNLTRSENFFAGIKLSETSVTMSRNEQRTITFTPTIPYGCYAVQGDIPTGKCKTKVHMTVPEPDTCELSDTNSGSQNILNYHTSQQAICGFEIEGCYPGDCSTPMRTASMNITTRFLSNDDPDSYRLRMVTQNAMTHKIWKGYSLDEVVVNIKDDISFENKVCFSHVDPHMQTADGKPYENNDFPGEFILYMNTEYSIMVQEKTISCFSDDDGRPFCTCAVAVRAGGDIFLINLCNDLKFIGMTSCKDNGALVIRQQDEFNYQVETNIGTLIKIRIRPYSRYEELMNIDIVMAPKDYTSIRGLCGTFDNNRNNDFHDRNGNALPDRLDFLNAWKIGADDTNYLKPTCRSNVTTWEEDGQQLFCSCNCYGDEKASCQAPETEAICSPSQYINCTVKLQKTEDLCTYFSHKCQSQNRKRRSGFIADPEKEMKRKLALAEKRNLSRRKRQLNEQSSLSKEEVKELCTSVVTKSTAVENFSNLLGGYNYSLTIEHCIFDVYESKDTGWVEAQDVALKDAVQMGFKRNANFTEMHKDVLVDFKKQFCPLNCSGNGNCTEEGVCICARGFFGPDCRHDVTNPPTIEDVEGGGVCDIRYGSECRCFEVQTDTLAESFHCRRVSRSVDINGTSETLDVAKVSGKYINIFTGECCFESHRDRRSVSTFIKVMHYEFDVSLSNDGVNYGSGVTLYVYDSLCQEFFTDINGMATVRLKDETCLIDNYCVEGNGTKVNDECYRCLTTSNRFNWTFDCNKLDEEDGDKTMLYIIIAAVGGATLIVISIILICIFKRRRNDSKREYIDNRDTNMVYINEHRPRIEPNDNAYDKLDDERLDRRPNDTGNVYTGLGKSDQKDTLNYETLTNTNTHPQDRKYEELKHIQERTV